MAAPLRLSVLDQSPVSAGHTPAEALANSLELAQLADRLGYHRLWYSEHHAMDLLACTAPEILITRALAATSRLRVGSGGIMLPHYSPYKVAELFRTLHAMFPGRVDLGIGRAPGGGHLESLALRRNRQIPTPDDFPQQLAELQAYLHPNTPNPAPPFQNLLAAPASPGAPTLWLLGSSMWSAVTAAAQGLPYAFAHFFSAAGTRQAIDFYHQNFQPNPILAPNPGAPSSTRPGESTGEAKVGVHPTATPQATIAIGAIVAPTQSEAEYLHASVRLLQRRIRSGDRRPVATPEDALRELAATPKPPNPLLAFTAGSLDDPETEFPRYLVGTPTHVATQLRHIAHELELHELIVNTITHSHAARLRSYTLLAEALNLPALNQQAA